MANDRVDLIAVLDPTEVEKSLKFIEKRVDAMVKHSDKRMVDMGKGLKEIADLSRVMLESFNKVGKDNMSVGSKKKFEDLEKGVLKVANAIDGLIKRQRLLEKIDIGGGEMKPRFEIRADIEKEIAAIDANALFRKLNRAIKDSEAVVKDSAAQMRRDLIIAFKDFNSDLISADALKAEIKAIEKQFDELVKKRREAQEVGPADVPRVQARDDEKLKNAQREGEALTKRLVTVVDQAKGEIHEDALVIQDDLAKILGDKSITGEGLKKELTEIEKRIDAVAQKSRDAQAMISQGPNRSFGGTTAQFKESNLGTIADGARDDMQKQIDRMMLSSEKRVEEGAIKMQGRLREAMSADIGTEKLIAEIAKLQRELNSIDKIKPLDITDAKEKAEIADLEAAMVKLNNAVEKSSGVVTDSAAERIAAESRAGQAARESAATSQQGYAEASKAVNKATARVRVWSTETKVAAMSAEELAESVKKIKPPKTPEQVRMFDRAILDADELKTKLTNEVTGGLANVASAAGEMKKELIAALDDPDIEAEDLTKKVASLNAELKKIKADATGREQISFTGEAGGVGGRSKDLAERRGRLIAGDEGAQLEQQVSRLMKSSVNEVTEGAATIQAQLNQAFRRPPSADEFRQLITDLKADADSLQSIKPADLVSKEEISDANNLATSLEELDKVATAAQGGTTGAGKDRISDEQELAQAINDRAKAGEITAKKADTAIKNSTKNVRRHAKVYKEVEEAAVVAGEEVVDSFGEIRAALTGLSAVDVEIFKQEGLNAYKDNVKDTTKLLKSNKTEVRLLAQQLSAMGEDAKDAFDKSEINAQEFKEKMEEVHGATSRVAGAFNEKIPSAAGRSQVSLWKLGNAADRVGFRGAGAIVRITDALGGIPKVAIAGVLAVAGIAAIITKLIALLGQLAVKAAKAFYEFTKGSVAAAKSVQVTDRQLGALIKAPELGRGFRQLLQAESFDVGLDLTKNFSRVIVPLTSSVDEIERASKVAATLAHAFQETEEAISNALKQAAGGHYRPLIQRFGMTQREIATIQQYQEEIGEFAGVVKGLEEALQFRGLSLNTFAGTLELLVGQFNVLKDQVQVTLGEPVRDALGEQLEKIFDIVDDRKGAMMEFFANLGETIAGVVDTAGDLVANIAGDISDDDIVEFDESLEALGEGVSAIVDGIGDLLSTEDQSLLDTVVNLTDAVTELSLNLAEVLDLVHDIQAAKNFLNFEIPFTDDKWVDIVKETMDVSKMFGVDATTKGIRGFFDEFEKLASGEVDPFEFRIKSFDEGREDFNEQVRGLPIIGNMVTAIEKLTTANDDAADSADGVSDAEKRLANTADASGNALRDLIDQRLGYTDQLQELEELLAAAAAAQEKIDDAQQKFDRGKTLAEGALQTRFARQGIDAETKRSEKREDLFADHMRNLLKQTDDFYADVLATGLAFDRKDEAAEVKYADKLVDIESDKADKKIDIEQKYRERLKDIRDKFDIDAEEAIRKNDAVSLLRIRRRMAAELKEAEKNRKRQEDDADSQAEDKREDAKVWLERQIRDNFTAEQQKLNDIVAADQEKRDELIKQYHWEYAEIDKEHERQAAQRLVNKQRAIDDMADQYAVRQTNMNEGLKAEFDIVKEWKDKESDYMRLKLQEQNNLIQQQYQMWATEGSLFMQALTNDPRHPNNLNPFTGVATQDPNLTGGIGDRAYPNREYDIVNGIPVYRQHGGYVTSGNVYGVNERGAEAFYSTQAGIIASHNPVMLTPGGGGQVTNNVNNSRSIDAEIYAMDPDHMTPIDRTLMRHMFTEELLANGI